MSSIENCTELYVRSGIVLESAHQFANEVRESVATAIGVWEHSLIVTDPTHLEVEEYAFNPYEMSILEMMQRVINTRHESAGFGNTSPAGINLDGAEFQIRSNNVAVENAMKLLTCHPLDLAQIKRRVTGMTMHQNIIPRSMKHASFGSWTVGLMLIDPSEAVVKMNDVGTLDIKPLHECIRIKPNEVKYEASAQNLDIQSRILHGLIISKYAL